MFNAERSNQLSILLILERILGGYRENSWDGSEEQTQGQCPRKVERTEILPVDVEMM